jgi:Ca2+-binding RTX toxin-like protein
VSYTPTAVGGLHQIDAVYGGDQAHSGSRGVSFVIATAALGAAPPACAGRPVTRASRGGAHRVTGTHRADVILGGSGNDRVFGGAGDDRLQGGPGNDIITPGPGHDRVNAGAGDDRIYARDGQRDVVDCGPGHDVAIVDALDRTRRCEVVIRGHAARRPSAPGPRPG